jgi:integrase
VASIRSRKRADGTTAHAVLYTLNSSQTAVTFDTLQAAQEFRDAVNSIGADRAMKAWGIGQTARVQKPKGPTTSEWCRQYIFTRTGVTKATLWDYESYVKHDIDPTIGEIPLTVLSRDDVGEFVQSMVEKDLAGKTMANRHGFLSAALNAAVKAELIPSNPAAGTRLPRTERAEMVFLTADEYALLWEGFLPRWRPLIDFMVMSGLRFGELSALKPSDVNQARGTVYVGRAWKRTYGHPRYELGVPKTKKSIRTINVDPAVLQALDYSSEFLFTNNVGKPIHGSQFRNGVWYPSVDRAKQLGLTKSPRIHDMRHTCASWMIAEGIALPTIQRHLGHESISTTVNLYGHLDRKDAENAAATIGKRLRLT